MKKLLSSLALLPLLSTPAMADISGDYTTQGNVQTYCETMRDQDKHNHFWAIRGFDGVNSYTGIDHNKYTKNVSSFVGLLQQSKIRHLLFFLKTVNYFKKQM